LSRAAETPKLCGFSNIFLSTRATHDVSVDSIYVDFPITLSPKPST
jgi:hypothetical protein